MNKSKEETIAFMNANPVCHLATVEGNVPPELTCRLMAAAKPGGRRISPKVELIPALHEKRTDEKERK